MKIAKVHIDGYGRFSNLDLGFSPGLQVIIGPNEQGKTTVRCFIGDVLYGQKRSATRNLYDEAHQLRTPWNDPDCYGGAITYALDNGTTYEVSRVFDKRRESVLVLDKTHGRDVTAEFELLQNRELNFAQSHLGLSKDVFLSTATISHFSLEDLGDRDALDEIRGKLLMLADSSEHSFTADDCLQLLAARIAAIGQPSARSRPLPAARLRLAELNHEYEQALLAQQQLEETSTARMTLLESIAGLRSRKSALEESLRLTAAHDRAQRLREAEALQARIDAVTQQVFALGASRDFPIEKGPEVQRTENLVSTARQQLDRSRGELRQLRAQMQTERQQLGTVEPLPLQEVPEHLAAKQAELHTYRQNVRARIVELEQLVEAAQARLAEAQRALGELPDFTRVASDPVEWFTQLASSFSVAQRSRDEECSLRTRLRAEVEERRKAVADLDVLFKDVENFPDLARDFELSKRVHRDHVNRAGTQIQQLQTVHEEIREHLPGIVLLCVTCVAFMLFLVTFFFYTGNSALLIAVAATALAAAYFGIKGGSSRVRLKRIGREIAAAKADMDGLEQAGVEGAHEIERLLMESGCRTVRELEAKYDQYREASARLQARVDVLEEQEKRAREAEERLPQLLQRYKEAFGQVGEVIEREADVKAATGRIIARYQEFRERKRRAHDSRNVWDRHQAELRRLQDAEVQCHEQLDRLTEDVRRFMREHGFTDESRHEDLQAALKSYAKQVGRHREQRARIDVFEEKVLGLETQVRQEETELERRELELNALLNQGGVASVRDWHSTAEKAREARELWSRRASVEEQLQSLLRGEDLNALRRQVQADGELPEVSREAPAGLQQEIETLNASIDEQTRQAHAIQVQLAERGAGIRSLNEIEEDRAALLRRVDHLQQELDASSYAMALIENIAVDKHARIAPKLASIASGYLREITGGAYQELRLSRDLRISVRIPGTGHLHDQPEKSLSKGAVDQIYFALRLALVQSISDTGERVPMLLDDPFANYDDARLDQTMRMLARIGERSQILLFTCREDVARAAEAVKAPVIVL